VTVVTKCVVRSAYDFLRDWVIQREYNRLSRHLLPSPAVRHIHPVRPYIPELP